MRLSSGPCPPVETMSEAGGEAQGPSAGGPGGPCPYLEAEVASAIRRGTGGPGLKRLKQSGRVGSCQQSTGPAPNKAPPDQLEPGPQSLCSVKECFSLIDSLLEKRDRLHPPGAELSQAHKGRAEPQKATLNLKSPASLPRALKCPAQPLSKLGSSSRPQGASLCGSNLHRCISLDSQWPSQPPAQL